MSGGSWDYAYGRLNDVVDGLRNNTCIRGYKLDLNAEQIASRQKLADLLEKVSAALHEIEWVDSGDTSYPKDVKAIDAVFAHMGRTPKIELRHDLDGKLDEIVAKEATLHMEDMGSSWSILIDAGSSHLNLSFGGKLKKPLVVEQRGSIIVTHPTREENDRG